MTRLSWKHMMEDLLNGVEGELRPSVPFKTKVVLKAFGKRLIEGRVARQRKRFEEELEAFLQSEPYLRAATKRYLKKRVIVALRESTRLLKRAAAMLSKHQFEQVQTRKAK